MAFALVTPGSVDEAVRLLGDPAAPPTAVLAGGTDLLFELSGTTAAPPRVLSLRKMPWRSIRWDGSSLEIGSTAPLRDLERAPRVRSDLPGLWSAVRAVGSVPLRHRATVGGNLARASPASDLIPILLTLDAVADLVGPHGRRRLPVGALVRGPRTTALGAGELIERVTIPEARPSAYLWQRVRPANDVSQVGVACAWSPTARHWRLAVGGAGPAPVRLPEVESVLDGPTPLAASTIAAAAAAASRLAPFSTDKRATEGYRRQVVEVLVRRALGSVAPPGGP
jgi:aerobic carbon-monoxide dehydrogenase medium subunit